MNLISNCCIGGDYYNVMKLEYNNPFTWDIIKPKDMIILIKTFNKVKFENIKLLPSEFSNDTRKCFKIRIDDLFEVHYPHYLKDERYKNIQYGSSETSVDVLYANIEDYIINTYKRRLLRMLKSNEEPKFLILGDRPGYKWTLENIKELENIKSEYKICLITDIDIDINLKHVSLIKSNSENHYQTRVKNDNEIKNILRI